MDDTQPNEVRLARKGSTNIPRVRTARPLHAPYPTPSKRPRWQPPATRAPFPSSGANRHELVVHLPPECQKRAPGSYNARKRWIEDQKYHLRTDRHLSVVSFTYLERDNSVLFICRAQQAPGHNARDSMKTGSYHVHAHLGQAPVKDSHTGLDQSSEPRPSRIGPNSHTFPGVGGCPQRPDTHSSIPSSGLSVERKPVKSSATETKWGPVQIVPTNTVAQHQPAVRYAPPTEIVVDLTLDHPGPSAENHTARWSTFRSGCVPISLPPLSSGDARISSPELNTDQRPSIHQAPAQVMAQCKDTSVVPISDTNSHSVRPNIRMNDTVLVCSSEDHRVHGLRQHDVLEAVRSSYPRVVAQDGEAELLPSPSNCSALIRAFTPACGNLPLALGPHDKPRRVLHDHDFTYIVTAHGIIDQVATTSVLKLDHNIRSPSLPYEELVDDACILSHQGDSVIILGHAREQDQIAFLRMTNSQVSRHITLRRDWNATKRPGVSAMASLLSPLKFVSGGYDHRVHLWDIAHDLSGASAVELAIKHTSLVHSLLPIVDTSHKLVSVGADRDVPIYDLSSERVVQTLKASCTPHHAHKADFRACTLLEVSHLEMQFEIRDHRKPNQAVQRFGFLAEERRGRFEKADSWSHFVACGDRNGAIHLWDLRNVSTEIALRQCFDDPVIQVVHTGPRLLACSKRNELACFDL